MNISLERLKDQMVQLWQNTSNGKKAILGISLLIFVIAIGFSIQTATQPDYRPLFTGLDVQEAGAIAEKLKEGKISYQLADDGTTILVPSKDLDQTRLNLANENMPTGGVVGLESLESTNFGETDAEQRAKFQRALQGELTRTIKQLAEVENARVHIVMPEPTLFSEDQKDTTASVMLKLKPYKKIVPEQVNGLVRLLSSSVEGLKPENITIVDTNMNDLTDMADVGKDEKTGAKLTASQIELQSAVQTDLEKSAQSMLERVLGHGKAVVRISAKLDFDQVQTKSEDWGDKVKRSEQTADENSSGTNTSPQGVPGTDSNTPAVPGYVTPDQTSQNDYNKSEKIVNYEIDRAEENRVVSPGSIKRLTAAVVVDGQQLSSKQQEAIQAAVANAVGLDVSRGDIISVTAMPFNTDYQKEMEDAMAKEEQMRMWLTFGGIGAAIIAGLTIFFVLRRRKVTPAVEEAPVFTVADMIGHTEIVAAEVETAVTMEREPSPEELERMKLFDEVQNLAKDNPNSVAQLLKTWMADE